MSLIKRDERIPSWSGFMNEFFNRDWMDWNQHNFSTTNTTLPSVNIKESTDDFEVEMAAPGFSKEDFKIELNNNVLCISSEKEVNDETKKDQEFTKHEFSYQSFSRTFTLPNIVDNEKIGAKYENGILKVTIPKREEAKPKPARLIKIK